MLALQIALDLDESTAVIAEIRDQIKEKLLDPGGKGALTREAWRIVSAEWHASGKSFLDFITTARKGAPLVTTVVNGDVQHTKALETVTTLTGGSNCAAEEEETKATAID